MFKHISPAELAEKIKNDKIKITDIRDLQSFNNGHIINAFHLDNNSIVNFINDTDKSETIIVCCYHGNSSQGAAQYFFEQGYQEVYSLDGGFEIWKVSQPSLVE